MATTGLREYHRKRNFTRTGEPRGKLRRRTGDLFVVQKHAARRLHYDFRLELDGVLKSWAVTRGPSLSPADKRLAVRTEDHPLDYAEFEGRIPEGEYGAGSIIVWDRGRWSTEGDAREQLAKGHLVVDLKGSKLKGRWHLVHMKGRDNRGKENWLLIKADDEYAVSSGKTDLLEVKPRSVKTGRTIEDVAASEVKIKPKRGRNADAGPRAPAVKALSADAGRGPAVASSSKAQEKVKGGKRAALPDFIEPQLATLAGKPPSGDSWVHEVKFDGYRLLARIDGGHVKLMTRRGLDWTAKFPSVKKALEALPVVTALLDGEVVVETERGTPDFAGLQADLSEGRSDRFHYYLFDLLYLDGVDLTGASLLDRKKALSRAPFRSRRRRTEIQRPLQRAWGYDARACLPPGPRGHRLQAQERPLSLRPLQGMAQDEVRRGKRVRHHRLRALDHAAARDRIAGAGLLSQGQARVRRPRRVGLFQPGCRGPLAQAGGDPRRRACA